MRQRVHSFYEATARQRIAGLLDAGSFREFCPPSSRQISPHLAAVGLPPAFDDGVVVGEGMIDGRTVLVAAQEGGFMGGAVGEIHGAKIAGLLERALDTRPAAVLLLLDTGGVRLQEANAGLVAMGEIQRAVMNARHAAITVIAAIGGRNGCYGGMSIIARCCDWIVMSEEGRLSISGPEVIETVSGVEEFDSRDRALVWRTMGGKHRRILGEADRLVDDDLAAFRGTLTTLLDQSRATDLVALEEEHARLAQRLKLLDDCKDGVDVWARYGINDPDRVPTLEAGPFNALLETLDRSAR